MNFQKQGWKLALACQPMAGKYYIGPVENLSRLVKIPITSNTDHGIRMWDLGVVGPVDKGSKASMPE